MNIELLIAGIVLLIVFAVLLGIARPRSGEVRPIASGVKGEAVSLVLTVSFLVGLGLIVSSIAQVALQ